MRRLVVVALALATVAGCGDGGKPESGASGSEAAAPTQAAGQDPTEAIPAPTAAPTTAPTAAETAEPVSAEAAPVVAAFERYRDAVLAKDWDTATGLVSRNIFEYYGRLRDDALYARVEELDAMSVFDEMQLFVLRQLASPPTSVALAEMTPQQVVRLAFEHNTWSPANGARAAA